MLRKSGNGGNVLPMIKVPKKKYQNFVSLIMKKKKKDG